jgi:RHS repeat-associated protein
MIYDAWGLPQRDPRLDMNYHGLSNISNFTGYTFDYVLDIFFAQHRFYDPDLRRFLSVDPIKDGHNWFAYVANNLVTWIDPWGLFADPGRISGKEAANAPRVPSPAISGKEAVNVPRVPPVISGKEAANAPRVPRSAISGKEAANAPQTPTSPQSQGISSPADITRPIVRNAVDGARSILSMFSLDSTEVGAWLLMMELNDNTNTFHAVQNNWQQFFGFNSMYDLFFYLGTDMRSAYFDFLYCDQQFRFWAWKGDYLNLGAGAELGIYVRSRIPGHWDVDRNLAMPMTMTMYYMGAQIAYHIPTDPQWWITSFNPAYQNVNAGNLGATFIVDFSMNPSKFYAFINSDDFENDRWNKVPGSRYKVRLDF